jgi:hypothetical protein
VASTGGTAAWLPSSVTAATALSSIEAGVRHDWAAESNYASTGLNLAIAAVKFIHYAADQELPALLECITDSSKAPILLSLLLSCLKLLQSCTEFEDSETRLALLSYAMATVQLAAKLSRAAADSHQASATHQHAVANTISLRTEAPEPVLGLRPVVTNNDCACGCCWLVGQSTPQE